MKYNFYIDESGDHSLININEDFPYFILCGILITEEENKKLNEQVNKLKIDFFGTTGVILHSRDIRRCEKGFKILFDLKVKEEFYKRLDLIIQNIDFTIISIGIKKDAYIKKYGKTAIDPYNLSLSYMLERLIFCMQNTGLVNIFVEKRGKKEDKQLLEYYNTIMNVGTYYVNAMDFNLHIGKFDFREKMKNDIGIQLADLCAYPIASYIRNKAEKNPAFELLKPKIYQKNGKIFGLKILP